MLESADSTTELFSWMHNLDPTAYVYPFAGLGLFTAASIHVIFTVFEWENLGPEVSRTKAERCLAISLRGFNSIGQYWALPVYWVSFPLFRRSLLAPRLTSRRPQIRQISLYYKINHLNKLSFGMDGEPFGSVRENIQDVKDGVMNYLRQLSPNDRASSRLNLKPEFDFHGWLSAIESRLIESSPIIHEPSEISAVGDSRQSTTPEEYNNSKRTQTPIAVVSRTDVSTMQHTQFRATLTDDFDRADADFWTDPWDCLSLEVSSWDWSYSTFLDTE